MIDWLVAHSVLVAVVVLVVLAVEMYRGALKP